MMLAALRTDTIADILRRTAEEHPGTAAQTRASVRHE